MAEQFALQSLKDFAANPLGTGFSMLLFRLPELLNEAERNARKTADCLKECAASAQSTKDAKG